MDSDSTVFDVHITIGSRNIVRNHTQQTDRKEAETDIIVQYKILRITVILSLLLFSGYIYVLIKRLFS